jgi:hypothetical protein
MPEAYLVMSLQKTIVRQGGAQRRNVHRNNHSAKDVEQMKPLETDNRNTNSMLH